MKIFATLLFFAIAVPAVAQTSDTSRVFPVVLTHKEVQAKYQVAQADGEKVKVLIMPGHEPAYGGSESTILKERNVVVDISQKLATHLRSDPAFDVTIARDKNAWLPALSDYFEEEWAKIERFVKSSKRATRTLMRHGELTDRDFEVAHNAAATDVALRLYGITKWANEEGYDLVLHPHLNDNPGATNHSGFAVYIPDAQFGNAEASKPLGEAIAYELNRFNASSTLPVENYAIVEDQDLIALGAYNTAQFPVVLIEYAYIYESKIAKEGARDAVLSDMAYQTYRGIRDYVGAPVEGDETLMLPHVWVPEEITAGESSKQIYALQAALKSTGHYPPVGQLLIGCPISGFVGECTISALKAFQASKGLEQTGSIGPRTVAALKAAGF